MSSGILALSWETCFVRPPHDRRGHRLKAGALPSTRTRTAQGNCWPPNRDSSRSSSDGGDRAMRPVAAGVKLRGTTGHGPTRSLTSAERDRGRGCLAEGGSTCRSTACRISSTKGASSSSTARRPPTCCGRWALRRPADRLARATGLRRTRTPCGAAAQQRWSSCQTTTSRDVRQAAVLPGLATDTSRRRSCRCRQPSRGRPGPLPS